MFSSHLPKTTKDPHQYIYAGAGLLLVVGMLLGIAMVASSQVHKAELRASMLASQRTAVMQCFESQLGAALNNCMIQAKTDQDGDSSATNLADDTVGFTRTSAVSSGNGTGLLPVAFSALR